MSFSPNFSIVEGWNDTLTVAFQQLRRIKFIVEKDFSFGDYDCAPNFGAMTTSNYQMYRSRYLKINKFMWISIDFKVTLAAPFINVIILKLPYNVKGDDLSSQQTGACYVQNAGSGAVGFCFVNPNSDLTVARNGGVGFTAGDARVTINAFFEVI